VFADPRNTGDRITTTSQKITNHRSIGDIVNYELVQSWVDAEREEEPKGQKVLLFHATYTRTMEPSYERTSFPERVHGCRAGPCRWVEHRL
jgi:hypothetical protein